MLQSYFDATEFENIPPSAALGRMGRVNHLRACIELQGFVPSKGKPVVKRSPCLSGGGTDLSVTYKFQGAQQDIRRTDVTFMLRDGEKVDDSTWVVLRRYYSDEKRPRECISTSYGDLMQFQPERYTEYYPHPLFDDSSLKRKLAYVGKRLRMAFERG